MPVRPGARCVSCSASNQTSQAKKPARSSRVKENQTFPIKLVPFCQSNQQVSTTHVTTKLPNKVERPWEVSKEAERTRPLDTGKKKGSRVLIPTGWQRDEGWRTRGLRWGDVERSCQTAGAPRSEGLALGRASTSGLAELGIAAAASRGTGRGRRVVPACPASRAPPGPAPALGGASARSQLQPSREVHACRRQLCRPQSRRAHSGRGRTTFRASGSPRLPSCSGRRLVPSLRARKARKGAAPARKTLFCMVRARGAQPCIAAIPCRLLRGRARLAPDDVGRPAA